MNPNPEIWGAPSTWANAKIQTITTSTYAEGLKCSAVKIANFGGNDNYWRGSLARGMTAGKITPQQGIDKTICPCGQDFNVSAFGKIAMINENGELAATPTRIIERTNHVNWCFCEMQEDTLAIPNHFFFMKSYTWSNYDNKGLDQFAPNATYGDNNKSEWQVPYLYYQINSLVLGIQVYCITNETATSLTATWRYLDDWKNNYSTQPICGLRIVVMGVNSINTSSPITIVYYNSTDKAQYSNSGMICVLDTIDTTDRNGHIVDTSFYGLYSYDDRGTCGYIFMPTYISKNVHTGVFPAWNMFNGQQLKRHSVTESAATYYYSIPYSDDNHEKIMKMTACFGCYFTPTSKYQFAYDMLDNDLCLPIIDNNGVTHGQYTRGVANSNNALYSKNSIRDMNYDPYAKHYGTYCKVCGYGGEYKSICPRCHATGDNLLNIPAMAQGPMWKLDPDDPEYGSLYAIDVERDQTTGFTNPNLHRRVSDALEELPNGYLHLPGTHETIDYPDSEYCSVKNFDTDTILDVPTITKYNGSQRYIEMSEVFVEKGYTTIGNGCFTDTDVVYVEIPEGITTIE